MSLIGQALDRTDGILKVTGGARYAAEYPQPHLAYGVLVMSTVANGRIQAFDLREAEALPGVLLVLTHANAMRLPHGGKAAFAPPAGRVLSLLQDDQVHYQNQPIALVIADSFERATDAARRVRVTYAPASAAAQLDFASAKRGARSPGTIHGQPADTLRGDMAQGTQAGAARIEAVYTTPYEHHNPMEPHATTAAWEGDQLTLYDATQYVSGAQHTVAQTLGIAPERIRVICPFVGGGFGCKGSAWSHVVLAAMAARQVGRPVKLVLERPQMFGPVGHRPFTEQHIMMAARADGTLTAQRHDVFSTTSVIEDWTETSALVTRMLYEVPNQQTSHRLVTLNLGTPTFTRAPGEASGSFALESAMDELAYALALDPVALRLKNYAQSEPGDGKPWSSKALRECYRAGAEKFAWERRNPAPRSMRAGRELVGLGMASATYPANRSPASAVARILSDGSAMVASGTQDLGTGTFTVMTQVAADALGFPMERVSFALGDTALPRAPVSGGSQSVASVSPAVRAAAQGARDKLVELARGDSGSPVYGATHAELTVENGWVVLRAAPSRRDPAAAIIARNGGQPIEVTAHVAPGGERQSYAFHSFGAVFAEVRVDPELGVIRVEQVVGAYGVGRLLNLKTARSQLMGGIVWGIGAALFEESLLDTRQGRFVNNNLAEYHVPSNADIHSIEVVFTDEIDPHINSLGTKGIGEIGITGVAGALANAVYHATGVRVRNLPITLDKILAGPGGMAT